VLPAEAVKVPKSVAVIMDGNGRWAAERGLPRSAGHKRGAESVRAVTRSCARLGVEELTLYAFSTENWQRPAHETRMLMALLKRYLIAERDELMSNGIVLRAIGELERLPEAVQRAYRETRDMSADNGGMVLRLALSYGARQEIFRAAQGMARLAIADPRAYEALNSEDFRGFLYDPHMRDPDLLIRTSYERRLSNFLLWQLSYAELYVTRAHWPDFREPELLEAFSDFAARERRYGGLIEPAPRAEEDA
jgi:undecaprenyl diphosphate synthase